MFRTDAMFSNILDLRLIEPEGAKPKLWRTGYIWVMHLNLFHFTNPTLVALNSKTAFYISVTEHDKNLIIRHIGRNHLRARHGATCL